VFRGSVLLLVSKTIRATKEDEPRTKRTKKNAKKSETGLKSSDPVFIRLIRPIRVQKNVAENNNMTEQKKLSITGSSLRAYIMIAVLALIWVYFHWATNYVFMTSRNLSNLMTQMSVTGILAVGMLMVIVSGNIDLSVGSVLGFAGGIAAFSLANLGYGFPSRSRSRSSLAF
jgi:hypothetical protein